MSVSKRAIPIAVQWQNFIGSRKYELEVRQRIVTARKSSEPTKPRNPSSPNRGSNHGRFPVCINCLVLASCPAIHRHYQNKNPPTLPR